MKSIQTILLFTILALSSHAAVVTVQNLDFEAGSNPNANNWTRVDGSGANSSPSCYVEAVVNYGTGRNMHLKADGGNYVEQALTASDEGAMDATTYNSFTVGFKYGQRQNASDSNIRIALWNTTTGSELVGTNFTITGAAHTWLGTGSWNLTYDSTAQSSGDVIELRVTSLDPDLGGNAWQNTASIDDVTIMATSEAPPEIPPSITTDPQDASALEFGYHTITVSASGSQPLSYQWLKGGATLPGEVAPDLVLSNIAPADAGEYSVVVTNSFGSVASAVATLTVELYDRDVSSATGLVARLLPQHADRFIVEFAPPESGKDAYELADDGDRIVLRGNNGVSVAAALNHYLREFCGCHFSRNGDQLALPVPLPRVGSSIRVSSPHDVRFFYNPTTFGYTSAWWGWDEWQREIDLLALSGVNMAQVMPGSEELFRRTLRDHFGYTDAEVRDWLCMPSHLPWMMLANIQNFGGPIPAGLIDGRLALGQQICTRMQELGMEPLVQGYYGMVPPDFQSRYPAADVRGQGGWAGGFTRPDMLNPTDPLFASFSEHYYQEVATLFPGVRYFAADPFHEGGDTSGINLGDAAQALLDGMTNAHPQGVWVAESWGSNPKQAMLDAVDKDRVLVLDLDCSNTENWRSRNAFNDTPWVWCAIQNFGGNTGMIGKLGAIAERPAAALADPNKGRMSGIGAVPEATDTIPVAYELLFEHSWTSTAPELEPWVRGYARRRYGKTLPELEQVWDILLDTAMDLQGNTQEPHNSIVMARPSLSSSITARTWSSSDIPYDPARLADAWGLMLAVSGEVCQSDAYQFDLADVARQVLCDLATRHQRMLGDAYNTGDDAGVHYHGDRILEIIDDLENLCASRPEWLLGTWISDARSWGSTTAESDLCEWNARVLLTTWSDSVSNLNDYANREWAGLLSGFYKPRWQQFLTALYDAVDNSLPFNESTVRASIGAWEVNWVDGTETYASSPVGDTVAIAQSLWTKYEAEATGNFDRDSHVVASTWTPSICSTTPVLWTRDVTGVINQTGTWVVALQYTSGGNALKPYEVSLDDGTGMVDRDVHQGWTGIDTYDNRYYLRVDSLPASLELRMITSGVGGTDSYGSISMVRCEEEIVSGSWAPADCSVNRKIWTQDVGGTVNTAGDYRITLTRTAGDSALTVDQVWLEQGGTRLATEVRDETLNDGAPVQSWTLHLGADPVVGAVQLKIAVGSATAAGSSGIITVEKLASVGLSNPVCWPEWAADHGIDSAQPGIDSDGDGIQDVFEFFQGTDPWVVDTDPLLWLQMDSGDLLLEHVWAADRAGMTFCVDSTDDLTGGWIDGFDTLIWDSDVLLPDGRTRRSYRIDAQDAQQFYRLRLEP